MATESPIRISETGRKWPSPKGPAANFASTSGNMSTEDFGLLLNSQGYAGNRMDAIPNRSGSAPPSMEGSFLGIERLLVQHNSGANAGFATVNTANQNSEEQLRADPAYLAYYCSNINLNPRLPSPLISSENFPVHRVGSFEKDLVLSSRGQSGKVLLPQGTLSTHKEELEDDYAMEQPCSIQVNEKDDIWPSQAIKTLSGEEKRAADLIQEESSPPDSTSHNKSLSLNPGLMEEAVDQDAGSSDSHETYAMTSTITKPGSVDNMRLSSNTESLDAPILSSQSLDCTASLFVNNSEVSTIEHEMKGLNISNMSKLGNKKFGETGQSVSESNMMQNPASSQENNLSDTHGAKSQILHHGVNSAHFGTDHFPHIFSKFVTSAQPVLHSSGFTPPLYATAAAYVNPANPFYTNVQAPGPGLYTSQYLGGYAFNPPSIPPYIAAYPPHGAVPVVVDGAMSSNFSGQAPGFSAGASISRGADMVHVNKFYGQYGFPMQPSFGDPMYMQYNRQPYGDVYGISGQLDQVSSRQTAKGQVVSCDLWKGPSSTASLDSNKFQQQKSTSQTDANSRRSGLMTPNYIIQHGNMNYMIPYPNSPISTPLLQGFPETGTVLGRRNEMRISPSGIGGVFSGWQGQRVLDNSNDPKFVNFLDELKSGKGRKFELSDIGGHVVEFSADQHGSRFIQQKLENCTAEEKAEVFEEVLPCASKLMTDVFGNYVIQKFFEYGSPEQRKELSNQLKGQILPLSLQMYGCRVIQKALEVIELEQKTQLVHELDGHVLRCVRDQNGNHVIQKCIESIPTQNIDFIISAFRNHVATLSMHPYGCRVIQRVLEHCTDELQCQFIVDEILDSACALAQDQYGNYVTQHVLERGKPHERSQIIRKLSGHIVQLSQHKFASNVIEKCMEYSDASDRDLLIAEIIGPDEGNDNLLTMMKDQFANYVVQKMLEVCSENQRMMLLSRIKVQAHALKKYTYGKHIVARLEQLGEENQTSG